MAKVRIRAPYVLVDVETQTSYAPKLSDYFDDTDPLVKAHRWAFATDEELAADAANPPLTEIVVETATAAPGEKRSTRRK